MAISPFKTFSPGEVLTAADLNASFSQITTNGEDLGWPATKAKDLDGFTLILDSDGDSNLRATADDVVALRLQGADLFIFDGDVASVADGITFTAVATGSAPIIGAQGTSTNVSLALQPKGTGDIEATAGGSETDILVTAAGSETNVALRLRGKGTGAVQLGDADLSFPDADGAAGESIITNGAGVLSFGAGFASGDRLLFQQTTPGGSFTKDTSIQANTALRIVTGTVGSDLTGSTFTGNFSNRNTGGQSATHTHSFSVSGTTSLKGNDGSISGPAGTGLTSAHDHTFSDSGTTGNASVTHTHTLDMSVDYYDATIGEAA